MLRKFAVSGRKIGGNVEESLASACASLNPTCEREVLDRCYPGKSQMGLGFLVWTGLQSNRRHSSYMYTKAWTLFGNNQNPQVLFDVIEACTAESCLVSLRTFKVVLN